MSDRPKLMKMLQYRKWFGPSRKRQDEERNLPEDDFRRVLVSIEMESFVTRLPLGRAIRRVARYEEAFLGSGSGDCCVEYTLLGVLTIDSLTSLEMDCARIGLVEDLPQTPEEC